MKKAVILINQYAKAESELYQSGRLKEELETLGVAVEIRRNALLAGVIAGKLERFFDADFCVYLDKDKYAGEILERAGMRLFNPIRAIADCDDKMRTCIALHGFPMPDTIAAPLCYLPQEPVSEKFLYGIAARLSFPLVVKECYGSLGKGVYLVHNAEELRAIAEKLKCVPHLFQKFIAESAGQDVRVIVIGGRVFSAMKRTSSGDFRSNVELGGKGEPFELDGAGTRLCEAVAKRLNLDYCGIDLLLSKDGFLVCEVNSNAFFGGMERVTGRNVARAYAQYIVETVYKT